MRMVRNSFAVIVIATACSVAAATPAHASALGWFDFAKNAKSQTNSTLSWSWNNQDTGRVYTAPIGRAGSGVTTNDCEIGRGWLPNGWYSGRGHWNGYNGSKIWGRVWYLQDKQCSGGRAYRTELFIHTEETPTQGQAGCQYPSGDGPQCWEGSIDYKSAACIKVAWAPDGAAGTIGDAHTRFHNTTTGGDSRHGSYYNYNILSVH